jgi:flagellar hook-associated protein 3 FlgL
MTPVSTSALFSTALFNIENNENQVAKYTDQAGSGYVSQNLAGYGAQAGQLTALNSSNAKLNSYIAGATSLSSQLDMQNTALNQVSTATQAALSAIQTAVGQGSATTLMASLQAQLTNVASALNTQYNGQYLFSGGNVNTPPVADSTLSNLNLPSDVTAAFTNGTAISATQLAGNTTVSTGQLASAISTPLFNALQQVQAYNAGPNGPLSGTLTQAQTTFLQGVVSQFSSAVTTANNAEAVNGVVQGQVSDLQTGLTDQQTTLQGVISNITDIDAAQVSNQLTLAQDALQVSAQVFQGLQGSSLLNLLTPTTTSAA